MKQELKSSLSEFELSDHTLESVSGGRRSRTYLDVDLDWPTLTADVNVAVNVGLMTVSGRGNRVGAGDVVVFR